MYSVRRLIYGVVLGVVFFLMALLGGALRGRVMATLSLIGVAISLEAQPAAVASLALKFDPMLGAIISILGNLIVIPVLVLIFDEITTRWNWARNRLRKVEKWSARYGKYGVWILVPLSPVLGAYVCVGIGFLMRWNIRLVLSAVLLGVIGSTFLITYGGWSVVRALRPLL